MYFLLSFLVFSFVWLYCKNTADEIYSIENACSSTALSSLRLSVNRRLLAVTFLGSQNVYMDF